MDICNDCCSENIYWFDGGIVSGVLPKTHWNAYKCRDCGNVMSDEPDYDLDATDK